MISSTNDRFGISLQKKIHKGNVQHHLKSSKPLERFQIDLVQLASMIATKEIKYLFTMMIISPSMARSDEMQIKLHKLQ